MCPIFSIKPVSLAHYPLFAELLQHFINTASAKGEDAAALQIACANNLPEVAQALGDERWEAITPALQVLAAASEPATRAALAANLHRLGKLVPEERQAAQILLPIVEVSPPSQAHEFSPRSTPRSHSSLMIWFSVRS